MVKKSSSILLLLPCILLDLSHSPYSVGIKLEHVITQLAHEVAEEHSRIEGDLMVNLSDEHFWFGGRGWFAQVRCCRPLTAAVEKLGAEFEEQAPLGVSHVKPSSRRCWERLKSNRPPLGAPSRHRLADIAACMLLAPLRPAAEDLQNGRVLSIFFK